MKTKLLVLFCALALLAAAADLKLTDGQTFKNYQIVSQTATTVTVRHAYGMSKVQKTQLPPDLLAKYPIDENGVAAEAAEIEKGRVLYEAQKKAAAESKGKAQMVDAAKKNERDARIAAEVAKGRDKKEVERQLAADDAAAKAAAALPGRIIEAVKDRAERYYEAEHKVGSGSTLVFGLKVSPDRPRPVPGWPGRYEVTGAYHFRYYESTWGGSFQSVAGYFSAYVQVDDEGYIKVTSFEQRNGPP